MRCWRKVLWSAAGLFLVMGAAALAAPRPTALELQADAEARFVAGQQVAAKHPELATSWQTVAAAAGPLNAAQADVNNALAQQDALAGPLQATLRRVNELINGAYVDRNVRWMMSGDYVEYTEKKKTLDSLNAQSQAIDDRLNAAQQRLDSAQGAYADAFTVYDTQLRQFQEEFNTLYKDEYAKRLKALQDLAKENQARLSQVFIVEELLPGEYGWTEGGKELGKVNITADNKVTGVPPDARQGTWKITSDGLVVTVGAEAWVFKPGPMSSMLGSTKPPGSTISTRQAMLRPTNPPDQAAYDAALKKLKDAARQASAGQAASTAAQPTQPAGRQTGARPAAAPAVKQPPAPAARQPNAVQTPVSLRPPYPGSDPGRMALQDAVREVARQAGLGYDFNTSYKNTDPVCRNWVTPDIQNVPFATAMQTLLSPKGLTYDIVNNSVVLKRS